MKRIITVCLIAICCTLALFSTSANAGCCYSNSYYDCDCGYGGGYYNGLRPGYYGNTYYGGGLIYLPNSPFFYHVVQNGTSTPSYNFVNDCRYASGCTKYYRVYKKCKIIGGYRDKHGCWVKKKRVCKFIRER